MGPWGLWQFSTPCYQISQECEGLVTTPISKLDFIASYFVCTEKKIVAQETHKVRPCCFTHIYVSMGAVIYAANDLLENRRKSSFLKHKIKSWDLICAILKLLWKRQFLLPTLPMTAIIWGFVFFYEQFSHSSAFLL